MITLVKQALPTILNYQQPSRVPERFQYYFYMFQPNRIFVVINISVASGHNKE